MVLIEAAIADSDCIIFPMQPGPFDVLSADAVNQIVVDCQAQHRTICVVNRAAKRNPLVAEAIAMIAEGGGGSPIVIEERYQYQVATLEGKVGQEKSKPIRAEIAKLWSAVKEVLRGR
jgi:cellulose biosynthesis protein BcsQ